MKYFILLITLVCISFYAFSQATQDPERARLIFTDVKLFWEAYNKDYPNIKSSTLRTDYLSLISPDLQKTYVPFIIGKDGTELAATINNNLFYFDNLKRLPFDTISLKKKIRKGYSKLKRLYNEAQFPDVYFAIGNFASAGAHMNGTLAISIEMFPDTVQVINNVTTVSYNLLPIVVLHEIVHFQQNYSKVNTLLASCIKEGAADFITELTYGKHSTEHIHKKAKPNEQSIWSEFQQIMDGTELHNWLYTHDRDRIKDLGYYVGYKICQSYYDNKKNKRQAIIEILNIKDYKQFLIDSRYSDKFNNRLY